MEYQNISNEISTNIFETFTGSLITAPVKVSGVYKIFVNKNGDLFLDDYNNRRVRLDLNQPYLPQVANFLKTKSTIDSFEKLKYGGFRRNTELSYHIPLYLNGSKETIPNYFVLTKAPNNTITNPLDLHKNGKIIDVIDLKKIGLYNILDELNKSYDYMLNMNWEDLTLTINGFSIDEEINVLKYFDLTDISANQNYFEVFNNKILNFYQKNNIIYPKFINIEFEFSWENSIIDKSTYNNFYGFLSTGKNINKTQYDINSLNIDLKDYQDKIIYEQLYNDIFTSKTFEDILTSINVLKPENKPYQLRYKVINIQPGDFIELLYPDDTLFFSYEIQNNDIKSTLRETIKSLCIKLSNKTNRYLVFNFDVNTNILTITCNILGNITLDYLMKVPKTFIDIDKRNIFENIKSTDLLVNSNNDILNSSSINLVQKVKIKNTYYQIEKIFYFDNNMYLRLIDFNNQLISNNDYVEIFQLKQNKLIELKPINFLSVNSNNKIFRQYDKQKFIEDLIIKFGIPSNNLLNDFNNAVNIFKTKNNFIDNLFYVDKNTKGELIESDIIKLSNNNNNDNSILNMLFNSPGCNSYLAPNLLNIDLGFYNKSGNQDYRLLKDDQIKFHYFLIKNESPNYLKNTIGELRYFTDKPKITSRLISSANNLDFCETIFLGVKYRLPQKYKNYQFATYLEFNDNTVLDIKYSLDVDNKNKTIYLKINKYFDFVDLIRGGNNDGDSLIDLSLFYCVSNPHNKNSNNISAFKTGGLLIGDTEIPVMYQSINQNFLINDWKILDPDTNKYYICIKRSFKTITQPLNELFTNEQEQYVYVYSSIKYNNQIYYYISISFKIIGIKQLRDDYFWCEDIEIKFFDTKDFFINQYTNLPTNKIFKVSKDNVIFNTPIINNQNNNQNIISTIIVDNSNKQFKLINYDKIFSVKKDYFEFTKLNKYDDESNLNVLEKYFYFPEFHHNTWNYQDLVNNYGYDSFDNITNNSTITLFNRNQLWNLIRDILSVEVRFKHSTEKQTYNLIHELLLSNLVEYSEINNIPINNPLFIEDSFCNLKVIANDDNYVIWNIDNKPQLTKIQRYHSVYLPYMKKVFNELEFQKQLTNNRQNSIFNIFDKNYLDESSNINATGIWNEVYGNIVSSLFTKNDILKFTIDYPKNDKLEIDSNFIIDKLCSLINIEDIIINDRNVNYLSKINQNVDRYIKESYIKWLLLNTYKLDSIINELGQKINYNIVGDVLNNINTNQNNSNVNFKIVLKPLLSYNTIFQNITFIFNRKQ